MHSIVDKYHHILRLQVQAQHLDKVIVHLTFGLWLSQYMLKTARGRHPHRPLGQSWSSLVEHMTLRKLAQKEYTSQGRSCISFFSLCVVLNFLLKPLFLVHFTRPGL